MSACHALRDTRNGSPHPDLRIYECVKHEMGLYGYRDEFRCFGISDRRQFVILELNVNPRPSPY